MGSSCLFKMKVVAKEEDGQEGECWESEGEQHDISIRDMQNWTRSGVPAHGHGC